MNFVFRLQYVYNESTDRNSTKPFCHSAIIHLKFCFNHMSEMYPCVDKWLSLCCIAVHVCLDRRHKWLYFVYLCIEAEAWGLLFG